MNGKDRLVTLAGVFITFVALLGSFALGEPMPPSSSDSGPDLSGRVLVRETLTDVSEYGEENSESSHTMEVGRTLVVSVTFLLTWSDEPADSSRFTNEGDTMTLRVTSPDGETLEEGPSDSGSLQVDFEYPEPRTFAFGEWLVKVLVGDCGDQVPLLNILGLRARADTGNPYTVSGEYRHWAGENSPGAGSKERDEGGFTPESPVGGPVRLPPVSFRDPLAVPLTGTYGVCSPRTVPTSLQEGTARPMEGHATPATTGVGVCLS